MQMSKYRNFVRLHQFLGSLQHTLVLAADEDKTASIMPLDQVPYELDPIHFGHVEIQQNKVWSGFGYTFKGGATAVAQRDSGKPQIRQDAAQQLEHEGFIVKHQDSDGGFFQHGLRFLLSYIFNYAELCMQ
jgi:hypothetical protein